MTSTVFVDQVTPVPASWLNDVNTTTYTTVPALGTAVSTTLPASIATKAASGANSDITSLASLTSINGGPLAGIRNRIINGDMRVDQRNNGSSITPVDTQFSADRWGCSLTQASKYSVQQTSGPGYGYSLGVTSLSNYSVAAGDFFGLRHTIEGHNFSDLQWGNPAAKTVTLSFQVKSSLTGTFGGAVANSGLNRNYPFTYTISTANTWETKSITIPGDTAGTWLGGTNIGAVLYFGLGVGSTYSGTAGTWAAGTKLSATGAVSVVGTNTATFHITNIQLEIGSTATTFEFRPYGQELAMCQRYFCLVSSVVLRGADYASVFVSRGWPVEMRVAPTTTLSAGTATLNKTTSGFYQDAPHSSGTVAAVAVFATAEL